MNTSTTKIHARSSAALVAAISAILVPTLALAAAPAEVSSMIEEIVVTAQKRSESLQNVPVSITALTSTQLSEMKMDSPSDLVTQIPNLQVNGIVGEASPVFSLRGVSMFDYSLNQSSPVASYIDEVYKGNFVLFGVEMYDLERIEVLRGPQGTLYGKNTTGGAINFITHKPGFETEGYVKAGVGNYNRQELEGAVQGAIIDDHVAARVAFTYTKADGWFRNVLAGHPDLEGVDQYGIRASFLFKANDDLSATLRWSMSHQSPQNYGIFAIAVPPSTDPQNPVTSGVGGLYYRTTTGNYGDPALANDQIAQNYTPKRHQDNSAIALTIDWSASDSYALTSITSWDDGSLFNPEGTDGAPIDIFKIPYIGKTKQLTQDLRVTSRGNGPFNFIFGAYYQNEKIFNSTENQFFGDVAYDFNADGVMNAQDCLDSAFYGCRFYNQFNQTRNTWAAYTDDSYALNEHWKIRGGLRYNHDNASQNNAFAEARSITEQPLFRIIPDPTTSLTATASQAIRNAAWTGRLGLDFTPSKDVLLYVNLSRGYRSGAFNAQFFFDPSEFTSVKPETVDSSEVGFKTAWLGGTLQLDGAIFNYSYKNQQMIDVQSSGHQPLINLGKSTIRGGELELVARPVASLTVRGGLGILDAKVKEGLINNGVQDIAGKQLPNAPKVSATLASDWDALRVSGWRMTLHGDMSYSASQYFEPANIAQLRQGGYTLINARVTLHNTDSHWDVSAWGRNLGDKFALTAGANLQSLGYFYSHRNAPRMFGVEGTYRF
ncbi:MAG: TonB-dependent receptor [Pseudomonadota bacterium]